MWCYTLMYICGCTLSVVVAMPDRQRHGDKNEVHSYRFPFIVRNSWGAKDPKKTTPLRRPVPYVIIHHTYSPAACFKKKECSAAMKHMQNMHIYQKEWWDIGFNFCVGSDGATYEGRGWKALGTHALHFNNVSIGICLIGDWSFRVPPAQQLKTVKNLIAAGVQHGHIQRKYKLIGHRQVGATACPGVALFEEIQSWKHYSPFPGSYQDLLLVTEF